MARRTALPLSAGAALALVMGVGTAPAAAASTVEVPQRLNVLQLNIWYQGSKIADGIKEIADIVAETEADIVMLSEAGPATDSIASELSARGEEFSSHSTSDAGVISRYPITETDAGNGFAKAIVDVAGTEIAVYSGHLEYRYYVNYLPRGYGGGTPAPLPTSEYGWDEIPDGPITDVELITELNQASGRYKAVEATISDADTERESGRSVLIGGDFNEASHLDWTERAKNERDHNGTVVPWDSTLTLERGGYLDSYRDVHPDELTHPGVTWPAGNRGFPTSELTWTPKADERDRIDYLFDNADDDLHATTAQVVGPRTSVVRNEFVDETSQDEFFTPEATWPSDHRGNLITYRLGDDEPGPGGNDVDSDSDDAAETDSDAGSDDAAETDSDAGSDETAETDSDDAASGDNAGDDTASGDYAGDDSDAATTGAGGEQADDDSGGGTASASDSAAKAGAAGSSEGESTETGRAGGRLPATGANPAGLALGTGLMIAGIAAVVLSRRRSRR